jgi:hypothetical protein
VSKSLLPTKEANQRLDVADNTGETTNCGNAAAPGYFRYTLIL